MKTNAPMPANFRSKLQCDHDMKRWRNSIGPSTILLTHRLHFLGPPKLFNRPDTGIPSSHFPAMIYVRGKPKPKILSEICVTTAQVFRSRYKKVCLSASGHHSLWAIESISTHRMSEPRPHRLGPRTPLPSQGGSCRASTVCNGRFMGIFTPHWTFFVSRPRPLTAVAARLTLQYCFPPWT